MLENIWNFKYLLFDSFGSISLSPEGSSVLGLPYSLSIVVSYPSSFCFATFAGYLTLLRCCCRLYFCFLLTFYTLCLCVLPRSYCIGHVCRYSSDGGVWPQLMFRSILIAFILSLRFLLCFPYIFQLLPRGPLYGLNRSCSSSIS